MSERLVKLFARMLYDIGRGYGSPQVKEFIKYILELRMDDKKKEELVKKALQIAIALKTSRSLELLDKFIESTFKGENVDIKKIKEFIRILVEHKGIKESRLRGIYLQALS